MQSGIKINGIVTCLPSHTTHNTNIDWISADLKKKLVTTLGINKRHIAPTDKSLIYYASQGCERLIDQLAIDRSEIGFILLVTQTGDSKIPNSVIQLQSRLEMSEHTLALEVNMGCSGFVQGMYLAESLLNSSDKKYGLLVCGDLSSRILEPQDSGTVPLFSDGVSSTLVSKSGEPNSSYTFSNSATNSDAIALVRKTDQEFLRLNGHKILMLGLQSVVPEVKTFLEKHDSESIDYFIFHQASKIINETIRRKLELPMDKCPETLSKYGNTSSATIPLTMSTLEHLSSKRNRLLLCGFGTGLSWATSVIDLPPINFMDIIER